MKTQHQLVLEHLKKYGSISQSEAEKEYDIRRLHLRIIHLRMQGYNITEERRPKVTNFGLSYKELTYVLI